MTVETRRADPADALIETLAAAATTAIRNQSPSLTCDVGWVRDLHPELDIGNAGAVSDSVCWIERRGVHRRRG